ncbi:helix-turn-helix domain-containing protein [Arenibaculum sp.]|jgi:putative transcriptional regulator|uniref:helix-turn-helix domain-containing protein n=1 Tax=Arenibaculum sp. TaxID=2865862 RepID=UPI002E100303|nr:helix-turn-helix domain-containing protein [Arenibaculum sp.]
MATVKMTREDAEKALREVDWKVVDAMTDDDIARQVAENPDAAPILTDAEMDRLAVAGRIRNIRGRLGLSQAAFAERFRIPLATVRDWEQGRRVPDAASQAYLTVIERNPEAVVAALDAA